MVTNWGRRVCPPLYSMPHAVSGALKQFCWFPYTVTEMAPLAPCPHHTHLSPGRWHETRGDWAGRHVQVTETLLCSRTTLLCFPFPFSLSPSSPLHPMNAPQDCLLGQVLSALFPFPRRIFPNWRRVGIQWRYAGWLDG